MEARFFNPYSSQAGTWSSGFLFRRNYGSLFHAVVVHESGWWEHDLRTPEGFDSRASGSSSAIATSANGSNLIRVIIIGEEGMLFVNGVFVATLDLGGLMGAGHVIAVGGYNKTDGVAGESTRFEGLKVRPIPSQGGVGPIGGSIEHHMPTTGRIDGYSTRVPLMDGIIEARFYNPYSSQAGKWSSGFLLRWAPSEPNNIFHTVTVTDAGRWYHYLRMGDSSNEQLTGSGFSTAISTSASGSNLIRIIAVGGEGTLFVNGEFVSALDLSGLTDVGRVTAVATFFLSDGVTGESTRFEGLTIRPF